MLHPRNFNKLIHKTYLCWRNSTTKFGPKFLQIQNGNGGQSQCNIPFKYPQLSQRCQFSNGNKEGIPPLPVVNRNSYSTVPWSETATEKRFENLDFRVLEWGDDYKKRLLKLKLQKGKKNGQKVFEISFKKFRFIDFTNIPVPEDAYAFVRALDRIIGELASEDFEQKLLQIKDMQSTNEIVNDDQQETTTRILVLRTVELMGQFHKFQLELVFFPDNVRKMMQTQICLGICAMNKKTMKENRINLPLHALPWLREQMAEMLTLHDGTEEIEKEAPAQIPQKFLQYI